MSAGEPGVKELVEVFAELSTRVDRIEAEGRRHSQGLAEDVLALVKSIGALQDQITMIREAAGLAAPRRDS